MKIRGIEVGAIADKMNEDQKAEAFDNFAKAIGIDYFTAMDALPPLWSKAQPEENGRVGYPDIGITNSIGVMDSKTVMELIAALPPLDLYATLVFLGAIPDAINDWRGMMR